MALLLRRSLISFSRKPVSVSSDILFFFSTTSSNANNSRTLISVSDRLIHQHDFPPRSALELSSNKFLLKCPEKVYSLITLLKDSGFSQAQIEEAIRRFYTVNVEVVQPKLNILLDLGLEPRDISKLLSGDPSILQRRSEQLRSNISVLKGILGSNAKVCDALRLSGWGSELLKTNLDKILVTNIELLHKCGVASKQIATYVAKYPRCLLHKPQRVQEFIDTVERMGVPRLSGRYLSAIRTLSSMSSKSWELKLELLRNLGLSENDILHIFRSMPQVFSVSERKLRDVSNIMVGVGKCDLSQLVRHPVIFLYSVEKRLKPRLELYQLLERKNLLKTKMKLATLCKLSYKKFSEFVSRFVDDLGDEIAAIKLKG